MRGIHFGSQITHLEVSTKTNHPLNRTLVILPMKNCSFLKTVEFLAMEFIGKSITIVTVVLLHQAEQVS